MPKLLVAYDPGGKGSWDLELLTIDGAGRSESLSPRPPRLWCYEDVDGAQEGSWFFCLPLAALRDRDVLEAQVVAPMVTLIGDGDGRGDPRAAFPEGALACPTPAGAE